VNALARGDTVPKTNSALPFAKSWIASDAQGAMNTSGTSTRLVGKEAYLRQTPGGKLLLVQLSPTKAGTAQGAAAELWAASW
jgi:hypothetical protein